MQPVSARAPRFWLLNDRQERIDSLNDESSMCKVFFNGLREQS